MTKEMFIICLVIAIIFFLSLLYEKYRAYSEKDFRVQYVSDKNGNYHFELPVFQTLQYKKFKIADEIYTQGTIIKCDDNSKHIVNKPNIYLIGCLRIFTQPYIPQLEQPTIKIVIQNYGAISLSVINQQTILDLKEEIINQYPNEAYSIEAISTLEKISKEEPVDQNSLKNLLDFIKKHEALISLACNLVSLVSGILGLL